MASHYINILGGRIKNAHQFLHTLMAYEIEVKILEVDQKALEDRLLELGAKKIYDGMVRTTYFKGNGLKKLNITLRVRDFGDYTLITLKRLISEHDAKVAEETEVRTAHYKQTVHLFETLGYKNKYELEKHRISYSLDNFRFEFDTYDSIPTFMEIEGPSYNEIVRIAEELDIEKKDLKPLSRSQLFHRYGVKY